MYQFSLAFGFDEKAGRISVVVGFKNPPFQELAVSQ
jgi:hypothetical protein